MQIVIDILPEEYDAICKVDSVVDVIPFRIAQAIKDGTVLPEHHGRLIDADKTALLSALFCYTKYTGIDEAPYEDATQALAFAPTIIEAATAGK